MNKPQLRFPEFKGEWEKKKLGEVVEFKAGYAFKSEQMLSEKSNFQLLKMSNVYKNELRLDRNASYWEKLNNKEKDFLLKEGDSVLTLTGTVGKQDYGYSVQIKENNKYLLNQRLVLLREIKDISNNDFISQLISNEKFLFYFFGEAKGGTGNQTNVGTDDVKKIQLFFPTLPEQTKIASFLTVVDEKIQALKKKHNLLEQYKKGVMQKLFSQELRFKDENGNDFPEWEVKKLGEITYKTDKKNKNREILPVYSISNVNGFVPQSEQFDGVDSNERGYDTSLYKIIEDDTFVYNPARINVGSIGFSGTIRRVIVSSLYVCFKTIDSVNDLFFNHYLNTPFFRDSVLRKGEGGVRIYLFYENFSEITIDLPCLEEQTAIANFLSALDEKINHTARQIGKTEVWKKGLLQKMFV